MFLLEDMLQLFYREKDFDYENFSCDKAIKDFRVDNGSISSFIARNQSMNKAEAKKIWKPEKYNFNRKNPMCDFIRKYNWERKKNGKIYTDFFVIYYLRMN